MAIPAWLVAAGTGVARGIGEGVGKIAGKLADWIPSPQQSRRKYIRKLEREQSALQKKFPRTDLDDYRLAELARKLREATKDASDQ